MGWCCFGTLLLCVCVLQTFIGQSNACINKGKKAPQALLFPPQLVDLLKDHLLMVALLILHPLCAVSQGSWGRCLLWKQLLPGGHRYLM